MARKIVPKEFYDLHSMRFSPRHACRGSGVSKLLHALWHERTHGGISEIAFLSAPVLSEG